MSSVKEKGASTLNNNLQNIKPFRGSGAKLPVKSAVVGEEIPKNEISTQAKNLNSAATDETKNQSNSSSEVLEKAGNVAQAIAKAPVLPIVVPTTNAKKLTEKVSDKKPEPPLHFIKKPAVIFIEGFSLFGLSNGDGIKEMADNFPGAKKFSWEDHDQIVSEIKKHAPNQPVVMVGHSFGGDTALEVASELNSAKNGFRSVDLIVSIDAVGMNKSIVPINVKSNLNFFGEGILPMLHGDPTVARNTKYTEVTNELRTDLHSKMDDNPEVQFQIFEKINQVLGNKGEEDIFIEISETNQIKDVLDAIKNSL